MTQLFQIAAKAAVNVSADASDRGLDLYFLDTIENPMEYDWTTNEVKEGNLVANVINYVNSYSPSAITMHIDSMGGDLASAISIYNFLKNHPAKITGKIYGFCASAATVIACAASKGKLTMPASGFFITHQASANNVTGNAKELEAVIAYVGKLTDSMADILAARNTKGKTAEEIRALWDNGDCWMMGTEAEEYGFVDGCYNAETPTVTARIDTAKKMYKNAPSVTAAVTATGTEIGALKAEIMDLKSLVSAALDKIRGTQADPKVNVTAQMADALAQPLADMMTGVESRVSAALTDVTEKVTAAVEAKYSADLKAVREENEQLKTTVANITADMQKFLGRQSGSTGTDGDSGKQSKVLTGSKVNR
jgi:ATP-dependent protease ClpP protease subunit